MPLSPGSQAAQTVPPAQTASGATVFQNRAFAIAILLAPILFTIGGFLDPVVHVTNGVANITANASANPVTNAIHLAAFVLGSFLLPISVIGMARLAMHGSPWLATIGGILGLLGWIPLSALTAQEDLTLQMAQLGASDLLGSLWERFNNDLTMTFFLVVYIIGHLLAYVVLAIALYRARVIRGWAAWTLAVSTPLTLAFFATRNRNETVGLVMEVLFCATFIVGSVPVAFAAWKGSDLDKA
jgi:hypothetical protein